MAEYLQCTEKGVKEIKTYLYWSFHTGEVYEVLEDEMQFLDNFQVPLLKRPNPNCKKCYGRFYSSKNMNTELYVPCMKCGKKCIDFDSLSVEDAPVLPVQ